jgi:hypothetical protein
MNITSRFNDSPQFPPIGGIPPVDDTQTATLTFDAAAAIDAAKALLKLNDYVVLKAKSYRQAQQRQAIAQAEAQWEREERESTERWAQTTLHNEIRDLMARCTFLYGVARARGASAEELQGGWTVTGVNIPITEFSDQGDDSHI